MAKTEKYILHKQWLYGRKDAAAHHVIAVRPHWHMLLLVTLCCTEVSPDELFNNHKFLHRNIYESSANYQSEGTQARI